jgi:hypothetical protein
MFTKPKYNVFCFENLYMIEDNIDVRQEFSSNFLCLNLKFRHFKPERHFEFPDQFY